MIGHRLGIGGDVKHFPGADARQCTSCDIADGIRTSFPRRDIHLSEFSHDGPDLWKRNEMQLNILSGRDVSHASGVSIGQLSNAAQLIGGETAKGNLDPDHLDVGLPLTVNAMLQPERFKYFHRSLTGLKAFDLVFEGFNFLQDFLGNRNGLDIRSCYRPGHAHC